MRANERPWVAMLTLFVAGGLWTVAPSAAADEAPDPHAAHHHAMGTMNTMKRAQRTVADYTVPEVNLVRDDGKTVSLAEELNDGKPVVLDFIFTTCTTICPVMSQILSQLQDKLGPERDKIHIVSISIDPEQDTPTRLAEYAKKFKAGPGWRYYTGTTEASLETQRAFDAYRGDKMNHVPLTFLRASPGSRWVRIDGFASAEELTYEVRQLVAAH